MNKQEQEAWDRMQEDFGKIPEHKPIPDLNELLSKVETSKNLKNSKVWTVAEEWGKPLSFTPDYTIKLNKHDKVMGCLDFNGDKLKFEGDVEESAQVFIDFLLSSFNQRIEEIKSEAIKEYNEQFDPRED